MIVRQFSKLSQTINKTKSDTNTFAFEEGKYEKFFKKVFWTELDSRLWDVNWFEDTDLKLCIILLYPLFLNNGSGKNVKEQIENLFGN